MRKNKVKRIMAMLCALALIMTSNNWPLDVSAAGTITWVSAGEEQFTINDMGYAFQRVTFSDFFVDGKSNNTSLGLTTGDAIPAEGIVSESGTYLIAENASTDSHTETWDKYIFQGKIKFGTTNENGIWFGNDSPYYGFVLKNKNNSQIEIAMYVGGDWISYDSVTSTNKELNGSSLFEDYLDIAVSFELIKTGSSDGVMKVGVFINGNLLNNQFSIIKDMSSQYFTWGRHMRMIGGENGLSYKSDETEYMPEQITLNELGTTPITDCSDMTAAGLSDVTGQHSESLLKKKIQFYVTPQASNEISLGAVSENSYTGLKFAWYEHEGEMRIQLYLMSDEGATLSSITGGLDLNWSPGDTQLLEVYMEAVDYDYTADDDGNYVEDDLLIYIWCNGIVETFMVQEDGYVLSNYIGNYVCIHRKNNSISYSSVEREEGEEDNLEKLTFNELDITPIADCADMSTSGLTDVTGQHSESLLKKKIQFYVTPQANTEISLGAVSSNSYTGLKFMWYEYEGEMRIQLYLMTEAASTLYSITGGLDLDWVPGTSHLLEVYMEPANNDGLSINIWCNGITTTYSLEKEGYVLSDYIGNYVCIHGKGQSVAYASVEREEEPEDEQFSVDDLGDEFERVTFADFTYENAEGETVSLGAETFVDTTEQILATRASKTWDHKLFQGYIKFTPGARGLLTFGSNTYNGIYIWTTSTGNIEVGVNPSVSGGNNYPKFLTIEQSDFSHALVGEWLDIAFSVELVDDGDDADTYSDAKIGIFVDEKLYTNQFYTIGDLNTDGYLNCGITRLFISGASGVDGVSVKSKKIKGDSSMEVANKNHIEITQADFDFGGVQGSEKRNDIAGELGTLRSEFQKGLNGTKLNVDVLFPASSDAKFCYGAKNSAEDGFTIYSDGSGNLVLHENTYDQQYVLSAEKAGTTLVGERINLQISYAHTAYAEARLGIWINGKLYGGDYLLIPFVDKLGTGIATVGTETAKVTIWMPLESKEPNAALKQTTLTDFDIKDNEKESARNYSTESILNTVFSARFRFWESNYFSYGSGSGAKYYSGFQFKVLNENELYLNCHDASVVTAWTYTFNSDMAGTKFTGEDFIFSISLEEIDLDKDEETDELKMGIFFNGKLYNNRYFYLEADTLDLPLESNLGIHLGSAGHDNIRYYSVMNLRQELALYTTPSDYGITDGTYAEMKEGSLSNEVNDITMNNKLLSADIKLEDGGNLLFGGNSADDSFKLFRDGDQLYLESVSGEFVKTAIAYDKAYVALDDIWNLKVALEAVEHDGSDTGKDDACVCVWIEDTIVGKYYADGFAIGDYMAVANVSVSSEERSVPNNYDYEEYTFADFGEFGLKYDTYKTDVASAITDMANDEVIIKDKLTIENGASVTVSGYTFTIEEELAVSVGDNKLLTTEITGNTFAFTLVQNLVDADVDGSKDDVCLTVYINGALCGNRQYYILNKGLDNTCNITVNGASVTTVAKDVVAWPIDIEEITTGFVLPDDKNSIGVNGTQVNAGESITAVGDYHIVYNTDDGKVNQAIAIYKPGDVNADNEVNVSDLVALKKAQAGIKELTKAGEHAADMNDDGALEKDDELLRTGLATSMQEVKEVNKQTVFGVLSDIHYIDGLNGHREENFRTALKQYRNNGAEVIIMNADLSDYGTQVSYERLVDTVEEVFPDESYRPKFIATADNHEYYDAWSSKDYTTVQERFLTYLANPLGQDELFTHTTVSGYHFIAVTSDTHGSDGIYADETIEKLEAALVQANQENETRPIFVAVHQPPKGTVAGDGAYPTQLNEIFAKYPQVVVFTSHTHESIKKENSIWQNEYTVVNTGSLYYVGGDLEFVNKDAEIDSYNEYAFDFGEGLLVRAGGNTVTIERHDFYSNEKIKQDWVVVTSANSPTLDEKTLAVQNDAVAPTFADETELKVLQKGETSVVLRFDAAVDNDFVYYYDVEVYDIEGNIASVSGKYANGYNSGLSNLLGMQELTIRGLAIGNTYTFKVYAVDRNGNKSNAITVEGTLKHDQLTSLLSLKHTLRADENGDFDVLVISDVQDNRPELCEETLNNIQMLVDEEEPDLVLFGGDNSFGMDTAEKMKTYISNMVGYVEEKKIPWAHVYGNHDDQDEVEYSAISKEEQQEIYESFDYCVSWDAGGLYGVGNCVLPVLNYDNDKIAFNVWLLDSNSYLYQRVDDTYYNGMKFYGHYDYVHEDQIAWYQNTSQLLEDYNGKTIPAMMLQHIAVQESGMAWADKDTLGLDYSGQMPDGCSASAINSGLFDAVLERGDINTMVFGHDHANDHMVEYKGVKLCGSSTVGVYQYHDDAILGGRVVTYSQSTGETSTYMSYLKDIEGYEGVQHTH